MKKTYKGGVGLGELNIDRMLMGFIEALIVNVRTFPSELKFQNYYLPFKLYNNIQRYYIIFQFFYR